MLNFKKIRVMGFKSFVDPTDLFIEPGLTGVVGPNGCGKSTLLKVLAGEWQAVAGECSVPLPCAYIDQHIALLDDRRSIVEHLNLLDTPLAEAELRTRLALLHLDASRVTQPTGQLSGGERLKLRFAQWYS